MAVFLRDAERRVFFLGGGDGDDSDEEDDELSSSLSLELITERKKH